MLVQQSACQERLLIVQINSRHRQKAPIPASSPMLSPNNSTPSTTALKGFRAIKAPLRVAPIQRIFHLLCHNQPAALHFADGAAYTHGTLGSDHGKAGGVLFHNFARNKANLAEMTEPTSWAAKAVLQAKRSNRTRNDATVRMVFPPATGYPPSQTDTGKMSTGFFI